MPVMGLEQGWLLILLPIVLWDCPLQPTAGLSYYGSHLLFCFFSFFLWSFPLSLHSLYFGRVLETFATSIKIQNVQAALACLVAEGSEVDSLV